MHLIIRLPLAAIILSVFTAFTPAGVNKEKSTSLISVAGTANAAEKTIFSASEKYNVWQLEQEGISFELFSKAIKGYSSLEKKGLLAKSNLITIIDFSKPSTQKRLFVLDLNTGEILFKTLVAHGRNSGKLFAKSFSNKTSSYTSSLGFYITKGTYTGSNGYSLKLTGCEKGFNNNAEKRAIVMHGAGYVSESFIEKNGFLGRSHGCPALPEELNKEIIDVIKNGTCLFIYFPMKNYLSKSAILKG